ncbi:valine--tRNA ligase [Candidatus Sumerlaeota bacterium]|nr:valine--tRNA ligase [Candidatus Sumerlaeota bacterium]
MTETLSKQYDPSELEARWYRAWDDRGYFKADADREGESYTIVIPPPNITGVLHMGHALNNTLQDVLIRWKRMQGFNVLWLPGTDHAGIATQNRVEQELRAEGLDRREMGREAFLDRVWGWRDKYGGIILEQLRKMGCSCDWSRTRFTLDEGLSHAVRLVFKRLYDEGLIYRGTYMVNWCPKDQTALSDDEVEYEQVQGHLWHIRYPLADGATVGGKDHIVVATTRPETMLGDTAVAMNPNDARYACLRGKACILPLMDRRMPFIEDDHVDPEFGTGLVKVTPAHDPNDYEMGKRHSLETINILHPDGRINANGGAYEGLDRFEARKRVVADLEAAGLLEKVEDHVHQVGHSYRSHAIVEPYVSEQWFVSMRPLVEPALRAVEEGRVRFVPKSWENTYFHWMRNVRDWCISRQLWWGHQIPVWYCHDCNHMTVIAHDEKVERCEKCGSGNVRQDEDVLDTWFSSALWPFSTMGWPEPTQDLKAFYPTSALLTAHEIIFFWVARMIMMGLKFMDDVPFRDVYIHPMVFDEKTKKKMSKSLGNIIDPIEMIEKYGTDAMRMTVCAYAVKGSNLYLSEERFAGYRNFMNKIWNSARFVAMNTEDLTVADLERGLDPAGVRIEDRWILDAFARTVRTATQSLADYEFDQFVHHVYHFVWGEYCDWYLELAKGRLYSKDDGADESARDSERAARRNAQIVLVTVLEGLCRLTHPVIPFIAEEIWQSLRDRYGAVAKGKAMGPGDAFGLGDAFAAESVMVAPWPDPALFAEMSDEERARMEMLMESIRAVRKIRSEMTVPPSEPVDVRIADEDAGRLEFLRSQAHHFEALARTGSLSFASRAEDGGDAATTQGFASTAVVGSTTISVALPPALLEAERDRLRKEIEKTRSLADRARAKLSNASFVERAPEKVVATERDRLDTAERQLAVLTARLAELEK